MHTDNILSSQLAFNYAVRHLFNERKSVYTAESNLDTPRHIERESIWWKIYSVLSIILILLAIAGIALTGSLSVSIFDYVDFGLSLVAMIGLFGFAFSKPIAKFRVWRVFLLRRCC